MKFKLTLITAALLLGAASYLAIKNNTSAPSDKREKISLALDWTPNTNHSGFFVAKNKGFYKNHGVELDILPYSTAATTDSLVSSSVADVGVGFAEGVVSSSASDAPVISIAAIVAGNTSSIATRKSDNITSLAQLDGKTYGGYGAPYEEAVLKQAIKHDGGQGNFSNITVATAPLQALESKQVDFVWIYDGWEKIQAELSGFQITTFSMVDHGIPNYYTPVIITSQKTIDNKKEAIRKFTKATQEGFEFARNNPAETASILISENPAGTFENEQLVYKSQQYLSQRYQEKGQAWGIQKNKYWHDYPRFMLDKRAVVDTSGKPAERLDFDSLYTNEFFE